MKNAAMDLRERLSRKPIVIAPGVFDALTASIATDAGFEALYVSGAAVSYTRLGRPDIGLLTLSEMADVVRNIRERVETPLIVDADTGHGNALNVQRSVRLFERAGANAIQLEDQSLPKRCGHLAGKSLVSAKEMVGKIKAAVDESIPQVLPLFFAFRIICHHYGHIRQCIHKGLRFFDRNFHPHHATTKRHIG